MTPAIFKAKARNTDYPIYVVAENLADAVRALDRPVYTNGNQDPFDLEIIKQISERTSHVVISRDVV